MRNRVTLVLCFAAAACSGAKINHLSSAYQPAEQAGKDQIAPALGQVAYSGAFKPPCNQPTDHETCDLEAQWYAAQAAQESANWGWWQMILSGFGFVGLPLPVINLSTGPNTSITLDIIRAAKPSRRGSFS